MQPVAIAAALAALALATGIDDTTEKARAEVESQLAKELGTIPAPRAIIRFAPSAGRGYALEAAHFELDGKPIAAPSIEQLKAATGAETIFRGEVAHGTHELSAKLLYAGDFGLLSYMTGYKFKLAQKVTFEAQRGLEVTLDLAPTLDTDKDWQHRLNLAVQRTQLMIAQVDATEPAPLTRPKPPAAAEPPPPEVALADQPKPPDAVIEAKKTPEQRAAATRRNKTGPAVAPAKEPEPEPAAAPVAVAVADEKPLEPPKPPPETVVQALTPAKEAPVAAAVPPVEAQSGGDWRVLALCGVLVLVGGGALFAWRRRPTTSRTA